MKKFVKNYIILYMPKYFYITTYGCQMNVHESEKIAGILSELGFEPCNDINDSDIAVFNTCCIRENAEKHAYGNIGISQIFPLLSSISITAFFWFCFFKISCFKLPKLCVPKIIST